MPKDSLKERLFIRVFNFLLPLLLALRLRKVKLISSGNNVVVSLTTFPARINHVHYTIESIISQSIQPDKLVLWLSRDEFMDLSRLPHKLIKLMDRGLNICFVDGNLKPHKKYFYAFDAFKDCSIITIDDDEYYPPNLIENFIKYRNSYPEVCIASKCRKITIENGEFNSYEKWPNVNSFHQPDKQLLKIGSGGVLYPSRFLSERVFDRLLLTKCALLTDDLWLKFANENTSAKVMCIANEYPRKFIPLIMMLKTPSLFSENVEKMNNDRVMDILVKELRIDPNTYI